MKKGRSVVMGLLSVGLILTVVWGMMPTTAMAQAQYSEALTMDPEAAALTGSIASVEVEADEKTVDVVWTGESAATLLLEVYDNENELLVKERRVPINSTEANNTQKVEMDSLPMESGFVLRATLLDGLGVEISDTYSLNRYTLDNQNLFKMTAADYGNKGDRLIEFTAQGLNANQALSDDSFMVLKDEVALVKETPEGPQVSADQDSSERGYRFEITDCSESLLAVFNQIDLTDEEMDYAFVIDGSDYCAIGITTLSVTDNMATLAGTSEEVKLDQYSEVGRLDASQNYHFTDLSIPLGPGNTMSCEDLMGTVKITTTWKSPIHTYANIGTTYEFKGVKTTFTSPNISQSFEITSLYIGGVPLLADVELALNFDVSGQASGTFFFHASGSLGCEFGIKPTIKFPFVEGYFQNKSTTPTFGYDGCELEGEIFTGFGLGPECKLYSVISFGGEVNAGVVTTGKISSVEYSDDNQKWHACKDFQCLQGEFKYRIGFAIGIKFFKFGKDIYSHSIFTSPAFATWYHSFPFNDGAIGLGEDGVCPHEGYRLYVIVMDDKGKLIPNAEVSYTPDEDAYEKHASGVTDAHGCATLYLPFIQSDQTGKYEPGETTIKVVATDEEGHTHTMETVFTEEGYAEGTKQLVTKELVIKLATYTISYKDTKSGRTENWPKDQVVYSNAIALSDNVPKKDGYTFKGWSLDKKAQTVDYNPGSKFTIDQNLTLYAVWEPITYTIDYNLDGGSANNPQSYTVETNTFKLANPTREDYTFVGWTGTNITNPTQEITIEKGSTGHRSYVANWQKNQYTIHFDQNKPTDASHDIAGTMDDQMVDIGESKALTANGYTLAGWEFTGWNTQTDGLGTAYGDGGVISDPTKTGVITLYAQWKPKTYTLSYDAGDGSGIMESQTLTYDIPGQLAKSTFTYSGHSFFRWSGLAIGRTYTDGQMVCNLSTLDHGGNPEDATLTALWNEIGTAAISVTDNAAFMSPGDTITLIMGTASYALPKVSEGLYQAKNFLPGTYQVQMGALDTGGQTLTVDDSGTGSAHFDYCTVTIASEPHGTPWIREEGTTTIEKVLVGSYLDMGETVDTGYHFTGYTATGTDPTWDPDDPNQENQRVMVNGQTAITAHIAVNGYTIEFKGNADGVEGTMDNEEMVYDLPQNLLANGFTRGGYTFTGWSTAPEWESDTPLYPDGSSVNNLTAENGGLVTLYAQWIGVPSEIAYEGNGGTGTMDNQRIYYGNSTTLSPNTFTRKNWHFTGWNTKADGSGTAYGDQGEYINTNTQKDSVLYLYAQWEKDPDPVNPPDPTNPTNPTDGSSVATPGTGIRGETGGMVLAAVLILALGVVIVAHDHGHQRDHKNKD